MIKGEILMSNGLLESAYNPDVLSCLANLSNDEVFTSPDVVNEMLDMLPQELFKNPDTTFLDQTTPNMIQRIIGIFERKPLISKGIFNFYLEYVI